MPNIEIQYKIHFQKRVILKIIYLNLVKNQIILKIKVMHLIQIKMKEII